MAQETTGDGGSPAGERQLEVVRRFFELMHRKEIDAWGELWHEQARIVTPYPAAGFPTTIEGKDEILSGFRGLFANFSSYDYELTALYPIAGADVVVAEWRVSARLSDDTEYTNENITVFGFRDDLIVDYHDYFDPRRFQVVVNALPQD